MCRGLLVMSWLQVLDPDGRSCSSARWSVQSCSGTFCQMVTVEEQMFAELARSTRWCSQLTAQQEVHLCAALSLSHVPHPLLEQPSEAVWGPVSDPMPPYWGDWDRTFDLLVSGRPALPPAPGYFTMITAPRSRLVNIVLESSNPIWHAQFLERGPFILKLLNNKLYTLCVTLFKSCNHYELILVHINKPQIRSVVKHCLKMITDNSLASQMLQSRVWISSYCHVSMLVFLQLCFLDERELRNYHQGIYNLFLCYFFWEIQTDFYRNFF